MKLKFETKIKILNWIIKKLKLDTSSTGLITAKGKDFQLLTHEVHISFFKEVTDEEMMNSVNKILSESLVKFVDDNSLTKYTIDRNTKSYNNCVGRIVFLNVTR